MDSPLSEGIPEDEVVPVSPRPGTPNTVFISYGRRQPILLFPRPELADVDDSDLDVDDFGLTNTFDGSTAEIAANSPRYRRRSSTFIDGVHDMPDEKSSLMAPAQLYSTMSGRLFHSGRIAIVLVGPPARGKT
jgi:hypothetical protein